MPHYGNYCGPNWSDGKSQPSVADGSSTPINDNDRYCQIHDTAYATPQSKLDEADLEFAANQFRTGTPVGLAMGAVVGAQGLLRKMGILNSKNKMFGRRKGGAKPKYKKRLPKKRQKLLKKLVTAFGKQRKRSGKSYVTIKTKRSGSTPFAGAVRKGPTKYRKSRATRRSNRGVQLEQEITGRVSDGNTVYVGAGTFPSEQVTDLICLQLVKALYMKKDSQLTDLLANLDTDATIEILAFDNTNPGVPVTAQTNTFNTNATYQQLALGIQGDNNLNGLKQIILNKANTSPNSRYSTITLNQTISGSTRSVSIQLTGHRFNIKTFQQLSVQNVTTASGGVVDATKTNNTTNNPLGGKIYRSKYGTGMEYRPANTTAPYYFGAGRLYGQIGAKGTALALQELPLGQHMYPSNKTADVIIAPGSIMRFKQGSSETITLEGHASLVRFAGNADKCITNRGKSMVIGLEPIVKQFVGQPSIVIDYELENKYFTSFSYRNDFMTGKINRTANLGELEAPVPMEPLTLTEPEP